MNDSNKEYLHEIEKSALLGNRAATIVLVDRFRKLRAAVEKALNSRYSDGAIVGADSSLLFDTYEEILKNQDDE